ncbi:hypothetical protein [Virgibacillus indicus]|uniref:hypothetical protein n=1 Tax=Virgibacillus indicus TaxID=2024554 RepID=UPI001F0AF2D2|nr:hypothetical protein [Virgibacillus indicus]
MSLFWVIVVTILVILYEWPKMDKEQKKEKWAFAGLTMAGFLLAVMLIYFPDTPGPNQLVGEIFRPLGKLME